MSRAEKILEEICKVDAESCEGEDDQSELELPFNIAQEGFSVNCKGNAVFDFSTNRIAESAKAMEVISEKIKSVIGKSFEIINVNVDERWIRVVTKIPGLNELLKKSMKTIHNDIQASLPESDFKIN